MKHLEEDSLGNSKAEIVLSKIINEHPEDIKLRRGVVNILTSISLVCKTIKFVRISGKYTKIYQTRHMLYDLLRKRYFSTARGHKFYERYPEARIPIECAITKRLRDGLLRDKPLTK